MSNLAADGFIDEIIECGSGAKRPPAAVRPLIPDVKHELDGGAGVPADRERAWGGIGVFKDEEERAHTLEQIVRCCCGHLISLELASSCAGLGAIARCLQDCFHTPVEAHQSAAARAK